jgi:hypothetical protein
MTWRQLGVASTDDLGCDFSYRTDFDVFTRCNSHPSEPWMPRHKTESHRRLVDAGAIRVSRADTGPDGGFYSAYSASSPPYFSSSLAIVSWDAAIARISLAAFRQCSAKY